MNKLTKKEFFDKFDESVHKQMEEKLNMPNVQGFILFENVTFDSSRFGDRTAVVFGNGYTYESWEIAQGKWLNDLPSQRQHATGYYIKE